MLGLRRAGAETLSYFPSIPGSTLFLEIYKHKCGPVPFSAPGSVNKTFLSCRVETFLSCCCALLPAPPPGAGSVSQSLGRGGLSTPPHT